MRYSNRPFGFELELYAPPEVVQRRGPTLFVKTAEWLGDAYQARYGDKLLAQGEGHSDFDPGRGLVEKCWSIEPDASVSGRKPGVELIAPKMSGLEDLRQLHRVVGLLRGARFTVDQSAGLHVHHAATPDVGFDIDAWKRLKANFYVLEPAFDRLMPGDRSYGNMAAASVRSVAVNGHHEVMQRIEDARTIEQVTTGIYDDFGLDLHHKLTGDKYAKLGTAEWRQHPATTDPDAAVNWVRLTQRVMDYSADNPELLTPWQPTTSFLEAAEQITLMPKHVGNRLMDRLLGTDRGPDGQASDLELYYREVLAKRQGRPVPPQPAGKGDRAGFSPISRP